LGITLVQACFLLSLVQLAGLSLGLVAGLVADGLGLRRSMVLGLLVLAAASALGGVWREATALLVLRAVEGLGFLLAVAPAPGLIRRLVPPQRMSAMLGWWGAYMPLGAALALLSGPAIIATLGWPGWWWLLSLLSLLCAGGLWRTVPAEPPRVPDAARAGWSGRLQHTLAAPGPWLVALCFAMYSGQWLAVVGFLPSVYQQAGVSAGVAGLLTALVAAVNIVGNVGSGRLLQQGVPAPRLLVAGYVTMALGALVAFGADAQGQSLPPAWRYLAVLLFSAVGGLIPGTLFSMAVRLAPGEHTVSTTVGWVQQWSAAGQFLGPPLVAWLAAFSGGWRWTWVATGACSLAGLVLCGLLARRLPTR
jgi:MFS family permease